MGPVRTPEIATVEFDRNKYGRPSLVDAAPFHALSNFILTERPHRLRFHELVFISSGCGSLDVDGASTELRPGRICLMAPGAVRRWRLNAAPQGRVVLFTRDFIGEFFSDARFLDDFLAFEARDCRFIDVEREGFARLIEIVDAMRRELDQLRDDSAHMLRALLYQLLVEIARRRHAATSRPRGPGGALHSRFAALVDGHFRCLRQVSEYAGLLGVNANHLNQVVRNATGCTASRVIHERLFLESRRLLLHTDRTVAAIASELGFADPSYFNRYFRRMAGVAPRAFRMRGKSTAFPTKTDLMAVRE
jgi:AraC-like DNA-binding protein